MERFYETRVAGRIDEFRGRLTESLKRRQFGVLHVHDVTAMLTSKGVEFPTPLVIMDVCNPANAKHALDATDNRIAPLLPCSIALWQDGEEVVVRYVRPIALAGFFPDAHGLAATAAQVDAAMSAAVKEALTGPESATDH